MSTPDVSIEIADVQAKLGGLMLQIIGLERRLAERDAEIAALKARDAEKAPVSRAAVGPFPVALEVVPVDTRAEILGSA